MHDQQETCAPQDNKRSLTPDTAAFRELVEADVRGTVSHTGASSLRSRQGVDRWIAELSRLQTSLGGQRAARTAEAQSSVIDLELAGDATQAQRTWSAHLRWIASSTRFGSAVDEALLEAQALDASLRSKDGHYRNAIEQHRTAMACDAHEPSDADLELWAVLSP